MGVSADLLETDRTRARRAKERVNFDRELAYSVLDEAYVAGLKDIEGYTHLILLYWMDAARRDLCERNFINKDTDESIGNISFSAGVAVLGESGDVGHLLRSADRSLYKAKADGRNCVVMSPHC